jgi:hypothetical protein
MSITERNIKLKEVFKYNDADLLLNKQEKVSDAQGATLKSYRQGRMISLIAFGVMFTLFALICAGVGIWMLVSPDGSLVIRLAILLATGFAILLMAASAANFFIRSGDILRGKVSQMQGVAKLYTRQYRDEYRSLGMGWFVKLDRKEFGLSTADQYATLEEGATYRIFYVKGYPLDMLLAIEAI